MANFTPGPWAVDPADSFLVTADCDGLMVAETDNADREDDEARANATLIVAAPEMYEALTEAKEFVENLQLPDMEWARVLDCIVAALAKADGKAGAQ